MEQKEFKYKMMLQFDQQFNDMVRQQSNDMIKYLAVLGAVFVAYGYLLTHQFDKDCTNCMAQTSVHLNMQCTAQCTNRFPNQSKSQPQDSAYCKLAIDCCNKTTIDSAGKSDHSIATLHGDHVKQPIVKHQDLLLGIHILANLVILFLIFMNFSYAYAFRKHQTIVERIRRTDSAFVYPLATLSQILDFKKPNNSVKWGNWIIEHYRNIFMLLLFCEIGLNVFYCCVVTNFCLKNWYCVIWLTPIVIIILGYRFYFKKLTRQRI